MTTNFQHTRASKPFVLRFSEPILAQKPLRLKYDPIRQVSLVEVAGKWVDAAVGCVVAGGTYVTRVQAETTDDN